MAYAKGINASKNVLTENTTPVPLQQIELTCTQLTKLQEELDAAIDSFADSQSLLSRAAAYWSKWPLWQQISLGFLLVFSLLILNLITLSMLTMISYISISVLLTDHHNQLLGNTQRFKAIIQNLTNLLGGLIGLIDNVHEQLKSELVNLQKTNEQLKEHISHLNEQTSLLTQQIHELIEVQNELQSIVQEHETTITKVTQTHEKQSALFQETQNQLEEVKQQSKQIQIQLSEKTSQLEQVRSEMASELNQAKQTVAALKESLICLSNPVLIQGEHKEIFQQKLQLFLNDQEKDFSHFATQTSQTSIELENTQRKLHTSLEQQAELKKQFSGLMSEFEELIKLYANQVSKTSSDDQNSLAQLKNFSIFIQNASSSESTMAETPRQILF